jgi:hypothetical protein
LTTSWWKTGASTPLQNQVLAVSAVERLIYRPNSRVCCYEYTPGPSGGWMAELGRGQYENKFWAGSTVDGFWKSFAPLLGPLPRGGRRRICQSATAVAQNERRTYQRENVRLLVLSFVFPSSCPLRLHAVMNASNVRVIAPSSPSLGHVQQPTLSFLLHIRLLPQSATCSRTHQAHACNV